MESEAQTRKKRIDTKLKDAGWKVVPFRDGMNLANLTHHAIEEYPNANGPADYALVSVGQLVGVVEAKKAIVGPRGVLVQAERYSLGVNDSHFNFAGYRVPLLYSTNGEVIYFHDVRHSQNTSRKLAQFHTPKALQEMLGSSFAESCDWFTSNPNNHRKLRSYQRDANTAVEGAIAKGKRQMLVAMANGGLNRWLALALRTASQVILAENREGTTVQSVKSETLRELTFPCRLWQSNGGLWGSWSCCWGRCPQASSVCRGFRGC